jgi:ABC-type Na+ efflux pump permease subunit
MNTPMTVRPVNALPTTAYRPNATFPTIWLIARRQMREAMRGRTTMTMLIFSLALLTGMVWFTLGPFVDIPHPGSFAGTIIAFYLSYIGLLNSQSSIGVAAGVFVGDKERGCLLPLLVTPVSNVALFVGKLLGAVLPALLYTIIGVVVYFAELVLFFQPHVLSLVPVLLSVLILLLTIAFALFGAVVASVISSRVSTFQSAQTYSSLVTTVLWIGFFVLVFTAASWGLWVFSLAVAGIYVLDVVLLIFSATTWRREEVMAKL